jgi:ketosteroid isomerase-like protein
MKFLTGFCVVIFLCGCSARTSDEEKVRAVITHMENAAEARDTSDVLKSVADDYTDSQGLDRAQLANYLRAYFLAHPKIELMVSVEELEFPADGLAHAQVTVTRLGLGDADREVFKVEFRRSADEWRVQRADRLVGP